MDIVTENSEDNVAYTGDETTETENWGNETLPLVFRRTVDPHAYKGGRGGMVPVTKIRASLMIGKLMVGGYEMVEGSSKVTVYFGHGYKHNVTTEEEAKTFLISQLK